MQLSSLPIGANTPNMTWEMECLSRNNDHFEFVTISVFITGEWYGRCNSWNNADLRKNCVEQGLNFDEIWLTLSTHPELSF